MVRVCARQFACLPSLLPLFPLPFPRLPSSLFAPILYRVGLCDQGEKCSREQDHTLLFYKHLGHDPLLSLLQLLQLFFTALARNPK